MLPNQTTLFILEYNRKHKDSTLFCQGVMRVQVYGVDIDKVVSRILR
jgi:hypothetical protein